MLAKDLLLSCMELEPHPDPCPLPHLRLPGPVEVMFSQLSLLERSNIVLSVMRLSIT